jgi:hypothetical protein
MILAAGRRLLHVSLTATGQLPEVLEGSRSEGISK